MKKIEAIIRPERVDDVKRALDEVGISGMNVTHVTGRGAQRGVIHQGRSGETVVVDMLPKAKLETIVPDSLVEAAIGAIVAASHTGVIGDGKIFVYPVDEAIRVRTGERGDAAL